MMNKIKQTFVVAILAIAASSAIAVPVYAADNWEVGSGNESRSQSDREKEAGCGGAATSIIKCSDQAGEGAIIYLLRYIIQLMTYGVGVLAVGGVVLAGIMYASASGNQEQVKKAKMMLFNVGLGLIAYAFMFAITNFLIPGGVFN